MLCKNACSSCVWQIYDLAVDPSLTYELVSGSCMAVQGLKTDRIQEEEGRVASQEAPDSDQENDPSTAVAGEQSKEPLSQTPSEADRKVPHSALYVAQDGIAAVHVLDWL